MSAGHIQVAVSSVAVYLSGAGGSCGEPKVWIIVSGYRERSRAIRRLLVKSEVKRLTIFWWNRRSLSRVFKGSPWGDMSILGYVNCLVQPSPCFLMSLCCSSSKAIGTAVGVIGFQATCYRTTSRQVLKTWEYLEEAPSKARSTCMFGTLVSIRHCSSAGRSSKWLDRSDSLRLIIMSSIRLIWSDWLEK